MPWTSSHYSGVAKKSNKTFKWRVLMTYWRTWIRSHTPTWLHERGLVVPKRKECPSFECCEWYVASDLRRSR